MATINVGYQARLVKKSSKFDVDIILVSLLIKTDKIKMITDYHFPLKPNNTKVA